jgi:hypothetical protein
MAREGKGGMVLAGSHIGAQECKMAAILEKFDLCATSEAMLLVRALGGKGTCPLF